jgi:23S rRNA (uracil-5-)-methyltransferase RumA
MKKKERHYINRLIEAYREPGAVPPCPHFGQCGGCLFQNISYENQLALKKEMVNDALQGIASVEFVHPSVPYRYRSRMDMVTAFGKRGLRRGGSYQTVIDITECRIMQEKSDFIYKKIRPLIEAIEDYDYLQHHGYLRYVVLRQVRYTGQVMVNFETAEKENRLRPVCEGITDHADSVSLIHSGGLADLSYGEIFETVKGGWIEESFDGIRYRITPNSFFQSNAEIALQMYRKIRGEVRGRVLDLCSGVGSISLFIAGAADHVTGIEMNRESTEIADINKSINGIENTEFVCSDVKDFLREAGESYETIVLDPPRSGMQYKVMHYIDHMKARKIIYMSCNPKTFRDDVIALHNYTVESVEPYDMFPQTPHVELLGILKPIF